MNEYLRIALYFVLNLGLESPSYVWLRGNSTDLKGSLKRLLLCNYISWPIALVFFSLYPDLIWLIEIGVFMTEVLILRYGFKDSLKTSVIISLCANLSSFLIGEVIKYYRL